MGKFIDIKTTIWERIYINSDEVFEDVIKAVKEKELVSDIVSLAISDSDSYSEVLYDTQEYIEPYENGNNPTVEVYSSDCEMVIDNTEGGE